jgi:hypothetical protein
LSQVERRRHTLDADRIEVPVQEDGPAGRFSANACNDVGTFAPYPLKLYLESKPFQIVMDKFGDILLARAARQRRVDGIDGNQLFEKR